jgi:hypothetical protein
MASLEDISLEQRDELALLMKELADNPDTRKETLRLTKRLRPNMPIPELEIEDFTNGKISAAEERVMQLESKLREKDAREELKSRRDNLIKKGLARDEADIDEIEKIMLEKNISNHETAAEYFDWMKQAATPTPNSAMGYNPSALSKFDLSKYWKNPQMGARDEAAKALTELRKNARPIGY